MSRRALAAGDTAPSRRHRKRVLTAEAPGQGHGPQPAAAASHSRRRALTAAGVHASLNSRLQSKPVKHSADLDEVGGASQDGRKSDGSSESSSRVPAHVGPTKTRRLEKGANLDPKRGATHLEKKSVTPKVMDDYRRRVKLALSFAKRRRLPARSGTDVDQLLTHFMNVKYRDGEHSSYGVKLLAAWMAIYPEFGKYGATHLPRTGRALKGWRRLVPGRTRKPYPSPIVAALVTALIHLG